MLIQMTVAIYIKYLCVYSVCLPLSNAEECIYCTEYW